MFLSEDQLTGSASNGALEAGMQWVQNLLLGQIGTIIAIIAVGILGLRMLNGSYPLRDGIRIVLGCFILLGSAAIARGLSDIAPGAGNAPAAASPYPPPVSVIAAKSEASSNPFDPYANAIK